MIVEKIEASYHEHCRECGDVYDPAYMIHIDIKYDEFTLCPSCAKELRKKIKKTSKRNEIKASCDLCQDLVSIDDLRIVYYADGPEDRVCPKCYKELEEGN